MAVSDSRVVTTEMPRAASSERSLTLRARVRAFSFQSPLWPPESSPPWAASRTTTYRGVGAGGACAAAEEPAAARRITAAAVTRALRFPTHFAKSAKWVGHPADGVLRFPTDFAKSAKWVGHPRGCLVQRINGQAAEQFGEEVGGLLGHDVASEGNFSQLFHGDGVGEEGDVGFAAADLVDSFAGVAQVTNVGLLADFFSVEREQPVEDDGVELGEVELALARGDFGECERGFDNVGFGAEQEVSAAGDGDKGRARLRFERLDIGRWVGRRQGCYSKEPLGLGFEGGRGYELRGGWAELPARRSPC